LPLGQVATVEGAVIEGPFKGFEGGPTLIVQSLNGRPTQADVRLLLKGFTQFTRPEQLDARIGGSYRLEGYETGGFVGHPPEILQRKDIVPFQTAGHYFRLEFQYVTCRAIDPVVYHPRDFARELGLFQGEARDVDGAAKVIGKGWMIAIGDRPWPKPLIGKSIETLGRYSAAERRDEWRLTGTWRTCQLTDQVGQKVALRGTLGSLKRDSNQWWLNFHGVRLCFEEIEKVAGWDPKLRGSVEVTGTLAVARLDSLNRFDAINPKPRNYFVLRDAAIAPLKEPLLATELYPEALGLDVPKDVE
jgi:hypothetical protein